MFQMKMLGTAAGGGFPQWNCSCTLCRRCRAGELQPRLQLQAAISADGRQWYLLNASPDLRTQIESHKALQPLATENPRNTPIAGIILTSADLDQVLGLLLLREFQPLTVYATALVRQTLEANTFFRVLHRVPNQLTWIDIHPNETFALGDSGIHCTPVPMAGSLPFYAQSTDVPPAAPGASIGLIIEYKSKQGTRRIAYTPSLPEITPELCAAYNRCDTILVDGTFWSDAELSRTHAGTPSARSIGHVPLSGPNGTLALLADIKHARKVLIHINNTNPLLDPASAEARAATAAGWEKGHDGWELGQA